MSNLIQHQAGRLVFWLYKPLDVADAHWKLDQNNILLSHFTQASRHAIFVSVNIASTLGIPLTVSKVAPAGLTSEQVTDDTRLTRFELIRNKTTKEVRLNTNDDARRTGWKGMSFLNLGLDLGIVGVTSLSDGAIWNIAESLIQDHGTDNMSINSRQSFASTLYLEVCDVKDSTRARVINFAQKSNQMYLQEKWKWTVLRGSIPSVTVVSLINLLETYNKWQEQHAQ